MPNKDISPQVEDIQSKLDIDEETLQGLGGELVINNINFPPPTTAVLSLLEIVESPFIIGIENASDIKLRHIHEALYILKYREEALADLFELVRFEKMAEKNVEFFQAYLNSLNYSNFSKKVFKFVETLGIFDSLSIVIQIQEYLSICFNALNMIPKKEDKQVKKKDTLIQNGLHK